MKTTTSTRILIVAISAVGYVAPVRADAWTSRPTVPPALVVPAAEKVVAHFHAVGAQVYACTPVAGATTYAWTLSRPDATLYDQKGGAAGTHGGGPTWSSKDGSSVVGKKVAQADAPSADAIPWLLLNADRTSGAGVFSKITHIQRVGTKNGKAPGEKCDAHTTGERRVDYSAEYYFYSAGTL